MRITMPRMCLQAVPAAHRGFLLRARQIPIEAMYEHACRQKRRLVLSGDCILLHLGLNCPGQACAYNANLDAKWTLITA